MWKWLRSWFAWRFSLGRLVIATVFLGAVVGLNVREIRPEAAWSVDGNDLVDCYRGWPFPFIVTRVNQPNCPPAIIEAFIREHGTGVKAFQRYSIPDTHRWSYNWGSKWLYCRRGLGGEKDFVTGGIIDALFALTGVALILFLQIPRRKEPEPVQSIPAPSRR
jgi:hypothetical protein